MPRNTKHRAYISVAVNKDSDLMRQLEEDEKRKGVPKSHLLVHYADEYVRLFIQGGIAPTITTSPVQNPTSEPDLPQEAVITSAFSDDELLDAFGD